MAETGAESSRGDAASPMKRALVVVNEQVAGSELRDALLARLDRDVSEIFVVAPALADSGLKHTMGDVDEAIEPARERLRSTLQELRGAGLSAEGEVGDSDPVQAISDEIVKFDPEQILVVAHRDEEGAFAEKGLLEQAERDFDLPVTELVVNREAEPEVLDVKKLGAWRRAQEGLAPLPQLSTPLAGRPARHPRCRRRHPGSRALAAECVGDATGVNDLEEGRLDAACAATILIALAMALVNLAHVVGLFLFQSVGYEGIFSRFFARLSLFGTPTAIAVVLVLQLAK